MCGSNEIEVRRVGNSFVSSDAILFDKFVNASSFGPSEMCKIQDRSG